MPRDFETLIKQGFSNVDNAQDIVERELGQLYRQSYESIIVQIKDLYSKIGKDITLVEARKYKRLDAILKTIESEYNGLTGKSIKITGLNSAFNYEEAFNRYTWALEQTVIDGYQLDVLKTLKKDSEWGFIPTDAVKASVMSENSGLTYIKTFNKNAVIRISDIQSALTRGLATGQSYSKTAKEIENSFNKGYSDAIRVVRTESGRNFTEGNLEATKKTNGLGIKTSKMWVATLDGKTRHDHGNADSQISDKDGNFHIGSSVGPGPGLLIGDDSASQNINCRCRYIDTIDGFPPDVRRVNGNIVPFVDYKTWKKSKK